MGVGAVGASRKRFGTLEHSLTMSAASRQNDIYSVRTYSTSSRLNWAGSFRLGVRTISAADGGAVQPSGRGTQVVGALSEIDLKDQEASKQASLLGSSAWAKRKNLTLGTQGTTINTKTSKIGPLAKYLCSSDDYKFGP